MLMTSYTAYIPPKDIFKNHEEEFRLVPDTKAKLALIFPPFWLAWQKLWLALLIYIVVMCAIILLAVSYPSIAISYLSILPGFYLLLEGYQLVCNNLEAQGWQYAGIVEGDNIEEAEIRFIINSGRLLAKPHYTRVPSNNSVISGNVLNQNNTSLFPE